MFIGCSKSAFKMPKPLPPIVKQYKRISLSGRIAGMFNTGIYLNQGDRYSILATGGITYYGRYTTTPEDGWSLMARIGKENRFFYPLSYGHNASTINSYDSGNLYVGFRSGRVNRYGEALDPDHYAWNSGSFRVYVIVWERENYVQIADLFERMKERSPDNKAIIDALSQAKRDKEIFLAEAKTSEEIEETKKEIEELKTVDSMLRSGKDRKIAELEGKLVSLTDSMRQLEGMKKQLEEERRKSELLTKELAEKEMREKDLLGRLESGKEGPPVIVVARPKDGSEVEVDTITFFGVAEDDQGLKGLEIFVNGNPLVTKASRNIKVSQKEYPRRLEFSERIPLERGKNEIKIWAIDTDGLTVGKILTIRYRETRKNVWGVVIGIDRYQNTRHLKYAVKDARAFYEHLIRNNRIPRENVTLLINQEANLIKLRSTLGTHLKNKVGKEDMAIIYFAGHGACEKDVMSPDKDGLEKYILPYDANPDDLYASALPMREISHIFHRIRSERLIFIADACYSGASGGRTISLTGIRANISDAFLDRIAGGKGRIILTASGPNEVSGEDEKLQHGVFTYFLLEGLRGKADTDKDGIITVDEAYRYVSREVPRATGQEQHPVKKGIVEGQLILGVIE
jgi:hypothetical protein